MATGDSPQSWRFRMEVSPGPSTESSVTFGRRGGCKQHVGGKAKQGRAVETNSQHQAVHQSHCGQRLEQLEHHSSAGHFSSGSPLGSAPSQHHWFEVCTPAAAVIAQCSAQLQHKGSPRSWLTPHWRSPSKPTPPNPCHHQEPGLKRRQRQTGGRGEQIVWGEVRMPSNVLRRFCAVAAVQESRMPWHCCPGAI